MQQQHIARSSCGTSCPLVAAPARGRAMRDAADFGRSHHCRKLFWTGSMDSMDGLSVEQGSGVQPPHSVAASQQSSPASSVPKSPVLIAAKRLAFELDHLSEVHTVPLQPCCGLNMVALGMLRQCRPPVQPSAKCAIAWLGHSTYKTRSLQCSGSCSWHAFCKYALQCSVLAHNVSNFPFAGPPRQGRVPDGGAGGPRPPDGAEASAAAPHLRRRQGLSTASIDAAHKFNPAVQPGSCGKGSVHDTDACLVHREARCSIMPTDQTVGVWQRLRFLGS